MVLTIAMLLTLVVVPASAAGPQVSVAMTADKTTVQRSSSDQEILITVTLNNPAAETDRPTAIGFDLKSANENVVLAEKATNRVKLAYSYVNDDDDTITGTATATYKTNAADKKGIFTFLYGDVTKTLPIKESSLELMTIKATIKANAPVGEYTISTEKMTIADTGDVGVIAKTIYDTNQTLTVTVVEALTGELPVTITAPVKGDTPETAITGTNYTGSITWDPTVSGTFAANTEYTANVELTANTGYQFASDVNPTVVGSDSVTGVTVKDSGSKLEFKATFPKTNDKEAPVCAAPTGVTATFGSALSTITLTNPTGNTAGKWYWMDNTQKVGSVKDNPHTYKAKFVPNDTANFSTVENISVTVNATKVALGAGSPIMIPIDVYYTGSPIEPTPKIMTELYGDELVLGQDYEIVKYEDNTNVGTGRIYIAPLTDGNYVFTGGSYNFTIKAGTSSISIIGDPSKTYDGKVVNDPAVSQSGSTGAVTYTYYTNEDCTTETTNANSGAASDGAAPKNAGDYWVVAAVAASANYNAATSAAKKFTISQKALTDSMITLGTQATYDGTAHGPVYSVKDGTTVLTKGIDYTEISGYNSVTNVGNTTLKISGTGNYKGTAQKDWSLVAKEVTITPTSGLSKTYGATDPTLTYTTSIDSDTTFKNKFDEAKSGELSYTGTNVGAYIIGIGTLKAGNNFNLKLDTTTAFFTINQATPVITATTPRQLVNNGVEVDISNWASFTNTDSDAKLTYTLGSAPAGITLAGNKLKAASSVAAGATFEIKVNAYGTHNFTAPTEFTIHVTVVNKKDAGVSITTPPTSKTYGDANFSLAATKTAPDGGTWSWNSSNPAILEIISGADTATPTIKVKKADTAGATLTVTYTSDTHYGSASAAITVAQKEVTISGITAANKEYDGSTTATPTGTAVINGKVGSDDVTVTAGTATFADKNVGTGKTVTFTGYSLSGADAGNYNLKAQPASVTANITAKVVKLTGGINATDRSYVKDNKTVDLTKGTLTFDGLVSGETLDVNIPTTGTISDAKVGTYNVTYSGVTLKDGTTGKASNYKLVSPLPTVTVNITKASATALSDIPVSQKYNVTTGEKAIGAVMPADAGTLTYTKGTESKTGSVTVTSWAVDATGKVTYTLSGGKVNDTVTLPVIIGSDNYADATVNVVITIIKATPTGEPAYTKITTSGKTLADAALTTTGSTLNPNAGTLVWVDNAGNVLPDTTTVEANKLYKWVFTPSDSTNYESINGTIKLWSKSSGGSGSYYPAGITFTTDLPVGTINRVAVNGKTLDTKNYVVNGSDVTLLQSYLDTLKAGKYTVKIENKTHVSTGTFTIKADGTLSSPRTADAGVCIYAAMALMSGTGAAYVTLRRKKEN